MIASKACISPKLVVGIWSSPRLLWSRSKTSEWIGSQSSVAIPRHCNNCIDVSVTWYGWSSSIERDITMMLTMTAEWSRFRAAKKRIQIGMRATLSVCLAGWVATLVIVAGSISQRARRGNLAIAALVLVKWD